MRMILFIAVMLGLIVVPTGSSLGLELVSYGDTAWRDSNLTSPDLYSPYGGWAETRLLLGDRSQPTVLRPYLKTNLALSSEDIPEENTLTYGVGMEVRPFAHNTSLARVPWLEWLTRVRAYAEYLNQSVTRDDKPAWNPSHDAVLGFDVWREYGAVDPDVQTLGNAPWGELYLGAAFHTTSFYLEDYDSIRSGLNVKAGMRYGRAHRPVMPYIVFDVNLTSSHGFFWENRVIGGVGMRTEIKTGKDSKIKLYAEQLWLACYPNDKPQASDLIPSNDSRIGFTYQLNRH